MHACVTFQLFLCCCRAVLILFSLCFSVILILERWAAFSLLNATGWSDVPSSLALRPKARLYLCHLTSVVTCCRSEEIFSWKSYLAKYRLPFVHAFLGLCLLHALFYTFPTPLPLHFTPPISTPAGCLTQLPDHPHPKTKMNKFSPAGSGIIHGATARLESNTRVFSSHLLARRIQQIYGSFQLGINVTHGLRDMAYILGPLSYSIKNRKEKNKTKARSGFLAITWLVVHQSLEHEVQRRSQQCPFRNMKRIHEVDHA